MKQNWKMGRNFFYKCKEIKLQFELKEWSGKALHDLNYGFVDVSTQNNINLWQLEAFSFKHEVKCQTQFTD